MAIFDVSFDPGVNTGYCVWDSCRIVEIPGRKNPGCLAGKGETFFDRFRSVRSQVSDLLSDLHFLGAIGRVAVEEFEVYHRAKMGDGDDGRGASFGKVSMVKCATVRGAILSIALSYTQHVSLVSKRRIKKTETARLAEYYGVTTKNKDALDAVQIGVCAAFDSRLRREMPQ